MSKLICPHCGTATSPEPHVFTARVLLKEPEHRHYAFKYSQGTATAVTPPISGYPVYGIIVCQACGKHFVAEKKDEEWSAVHPIQHKPVATEIPEPIRSRFEEANLCFAVGAYKACLAICMVALESLWQQQNASGLNDLKARGVISSRLFDQATEIRLWAGLVKHELIQEPATREEIEELLTYLGEILYDVYIRPTRLAALADKRKQAKEGNKPEASPSGSQ